MTNALRIGGLALCAATVNLAAAVSAAGPPKAPGLCDACLEVCTPPLSHEDELLDESTDSYMPEAPRVVATAAAIELAIALRRIHGGYTAGDFGPAYAAHSGDIDRLAEKRAESDLATSAEIRSLKLVRTSLYADTVVGLRALAAASHAREFLVAYRASEPVLDGVLGALRSEQHMRAAERRAVCRVLAQVP